MFKPVLYVICDKYKLLSSVIFSCYPIPQLNFKFECFAVSLQRMTLCMNFTQKLFKRHLCPQKINIFSLYPVILN